MARHYKSSSRKGGGINHQADHHNDEMKHEKDLHPRDMYHPGMSAAESYMGMNPSMRGGMEHDPMIKEDHRAIANLPQEVMIKPYPMNKPYMREVLNDDITGVDAQIDYDDEQRSRHFYPKKV